MGLFFGLNSIQNYYFIDELGVDDAGRNGSPGQEWLTLDYAVGRVTSGDTVFVNSGTYICTARITLPTGISIKGAGDTSILVSNAPTTGDAELIRMYSTDEGTLGNQSISYLKFDGDSQTAYRCIKMWRRSNVLIHHCTFNDFQITGIHIDGLLSSGSPFNYATGNKIYNCTIDNCSGMASASSSYGAVYFNGQDGGLIHDNVITQTSRADGDNGYLIKSVSGYNKNVKIYNNTLTKAPFITNYAFNFAIELWNCRGGVEIYNNTMNCTIDIGGSSTSKGDSTYSVYIHHNNIGPDTLGALEYVRGIALEDSGSDGSKGITDVIISHNRIKNVANPIHIIPQISTDFVNNIHIFYNIFENIGVNESGANNKSWGVKWSPDFYDMTADNINILNNIFVASTSSKVTMWGVGLPNIGTSTNVNMKNNIIVGFDYGPTYTDGTSGGTIDILSIENNIFYLNGNSNLPRYLNMTPTNNTTQNNIIDNPDFVSASDFHLQLGSPAINQGLDVGLLTDYDGVAVANPPEIGAHEYV